MPLLVSYAKKNADNAVEPSDHITPASLDVTL